MNINNRSVGGDNNKRGNRYESYFATYKLVRATNEHAQNVNTVRMREQAGCDVDDFVSQEPGIRCYYQLKANKAITRGTDAGKLKNEFRAQKLYCESKNENFRLFVVVSEVGRKESFEKNMPSDLSRVTEIFLFPEVERLKDLLLFSGLLDTHLRGICALRHPRANTHKDILEYVNSAWLEHTPDSDGYCVLSDVLLNIKNKNVPLIAFDWNPKPSWWDKLQVVLNGIPSFEWWADRGYLEYKCGNDKGAFQSACDSEEFERFAYRLLENRPTTFEDFEKQL